MRKREWVRGHVMAETLIVCQRKSGRWRRKATVAVIRPERLPTTVARSSAASIRSSAVESVFLQSGGKARANLGR